MEEQLARAHEAQRDAERALSRKEADVTGVIDKMNDTAAQIDKERFVRTIG